MICIGNNYIASLSAITFLNDNSYVDFSEIFRTYGVEKADNIASACEFNVVSLVRKRKRVKSLI
ncbi:MAG: hypothetical protein GX928_07060 [Ruminococcaceae bacterium]|nr:hypothetical protein [Oscillospiraceae bacterium]